MTLMLKYIYISYILFNYD